MEIEAAAINNETGFGDTGSTTVAPGGKLGKDEFLNLLITQMQNQDPLKPMDSTAMVSQLAQFSALEQMQNLNEQFDAIRMEQSLMQALILQGEDVTLELTDGSVVQGTVEKVLWSNGIMEIKINDTLYAITDIASISLSKSGESVTDLESGSESVTQTVTKLEKE